MTFSDHCKTAADVRASAKRSYDLRQASYVTAKPARPTRVLPPPQPSPLPAPPPSPVVAPGPVELPPGPPVSITKTIIAVTASLCRMKVTEFLAAERSQPGVRFRQIAVYVAREAEHTTWNYLGNAIWRDHTTAIHACRVVARRLASNDSVTIAVIAAIKARLRGEDASIDHLLPAKRPPKLPPAPRKKPPPLWTAHEIALVHRMYAERRSPRERAEALGRTPSAIRRKAVKLGIDTGLR